ncbi:hypothetical protein C2G38_2106112 [Gigaspora rosea]|uniref:Membrane anchor Opy2 N-terminal domain-containing protein n=1 Tax=Gigaspora rosea TaxID=44941 RepID=A0A397UJL6_9GLOM|nr:hypothetical protein C2G38_2106112 [Gigaspora rosea]
MMVRVRVFLMFLVIALLVMVQTNIQVECAPTTKPIVRTGCQPCPPCRGTVVKRMSCEFACPVCYY